MKTIKRALIIVLGIVLVGGFAHADDRIVDYSELPVKSRSFLEKYFGRVPSVREVERDYDGYEVELRNGYDVKFNADGVLVEIDSPHRRNVLQRIVNDVLPAKAITYLVENDMIDKVDDIKLYQNGEYVVKINRALNDFKIKFDREGNVLKRMK